MKVIVQGNDKLVALRFEDKAQVRFNHPTHGWLEVQWDDQKSWFQLNSVVAITTDGAPMP